MATVTWRGAGLDELASTGANWDNVTGPVTGDDLVFDGAFPVTGSKDCTLDLSFTVGSITATNGYGGDIGLTVNFDVTGTLNWDGTGTLQFNGITTSANAISVDGSAAGSIQFGSATISVAANLSLSNPNLTFDAGTSHVIGTGANLSIAVSRLFDFTSNSSGGGSLTIFESMTVHGFDILGDGITIDADTIFVEGDYVINLVNPGSAVDGTASFEFSGGNNQAWSIPSGAGIHNAITINKSGGTLSPSGTINLINLSYTAGTVDFGTSKIQLFFSGTWNVTGLTLYDVEISASRALSLGSSTFRLTHTLTTGSGSSISGGTLNLDGATHVGGDLSLNNLKIQDGTTATLNAGTTYTVAGRFTSVGSTINGNSCFIIVNGTQTVSGTAANNIDSSGGKLVHNVGGTNTSTVNWTTEAPIRYGSVFQSAVVGIA